MSAADRELLEKQCNAAVQSLLSQDMQQLLDEAAARERRRKRATERPARPIMAMPLVGGDISLVAEIIRHRDRAVLISNDTCELWLPRSHVRRVVKRQVIVTEWIAARKSLYLEFYKNQSPQYLEWIEKKKVERERSARALASMPRGGFQYKFDGRI